MSEQVPVRWDEELAKQAKEVAALERPSLSTISLRGGIMKYMDQQVPNNELACLVVASAFENQWFKNKFDPNRRENPQCFSLSPDGVNMKPHEDSPELQAENCEDCPLHAWGSAPDGGRGKACKQVRRLAVLPAAILKDMDPAKVSSAEMALIKIPVTSVRNWSNYVNSVSNEYNRPPWGVLTQVKTEPDARTQFQVRFKCLGLVADEFMSAVLTRHRSAMDILMAPYDYSGQSEEERPGKVDKSGKKY